MNYQEELRKLKKEQSRLDSINNEIGMIFKKILYSLVMVVGTLGIGIAMASWQIGLRESDVGFILLAIIQDCCMFIGWIFATIMWFVDLEGNIENINEFFFKLTEASELRKGEKERKAKIEFFERLQNDTDFRKAWEDQMTGEK